MAKKIGIVGAGIGGLAAAALLHDKGHEVEIFDQFDAPKPQGSGLVIQPVGQHVLDVIGVGDLARAKAAHLVRMQGRDVRTGKRVLDVSYARINPDVFGLSIHRSTLFDLLYDAVVQRGVRLTTSFSVASRSGNQLVAADGRISASFDLIVDASGVHSNLSPLKAKELLFGAVWGTVDWPQETSLPSNWLSQRYRGAANMAGIMPCGTGLKDDSQKAAIFWSLPTDSMDDWREKGVDSWRKEAIELWPEYEPFASQITDIVHLTPAKYSHGSLSKVWGEGIAYIGDAAHRASPQLGQGANMALLDALALTCALEVEEGEAALRLYGKSRKWHVSIYQLMSYVFTPQYQSNSTLQPLLRDKLFFPLSLVPPIPNILTRIVCGNMIEPIAKIYDRAAWT